MTITFIERLKLSGFGPPRSPCKQANRGAGRSPLQRAKDRVSFVQAATVFADPLARIHDDPEHSVGEVREIIGGVAANGSVLLVSFSERDDSVRLISARRATAREKREYEEAHK